MANHTVHQEIEEINKKIRSNHENMDQVTKDMSDAGWAKTEQGRFDELFNRHCGLMAEANDLQEKLEDAFRKLGLNV